jgi:hypothetical protein
MELPPHIAARIRTEVAKLCRRDDGYHIDNEGVDAKALPLMGTIGSVWLLREDGTFWDVDSDLTGKPLSPLPKASEIQALVLGAQRHPWLSELLPKRPHTARDCRTCRASGRFHPSNASANAGEGLLCPDCNALGWIA